MVSIRISIEEYRHNVVYMALACDHIASWSFFPLSVESEHFTQFTPTAHEVIVNSQVNILPPAYKLLWDIKGPRRMPSICSPFEKALTDAMHDEWGHQPILV